MTSPQPTTGAPETTGGTAASTTATGEPGEAVVTNSVSIGAVEPEAAEAVQVGLRTAHAAIWSYGVISAYDSTDTDLIRAFRLGNIQIRDAASDLLLSAGVEPVNTEVAYRLPIAVGDQATARQLAVVIETDATSAWRAVIGSTDNYALRRFALTALSEASVRLTRWKSIAGQTPWTVPFPGVDSV